MNFTFELKDKRQWERGKRLGETFHEELKKRLWPALEEEARALYQEVRIHARKVPNGPMTAVFKNITRPLEMTGFSLQQDNFRIIEKRITKDGIILRWGVPPGRPVPKSSSTSKYKSLAELLTALHGGPDLNNPKTWKRQKVTVRMHILFARVASQQAYRRGRSHKKKAGNPRARLTGRARELDRQAKGRDVPVLRVGTILQRKARPFLRDAYRARKPHIRETLKRVVKEALVAAMKK